jgi:hypothetical protein
MQALYPSHLAALQEGPPIVVLESSAVGRAPRALQAALDALGEASAAAQGLGGAITTASRMSMDASQRAYIALPWGYTGASGQACTPIGFLKVGQRALYLSVPARAANWAGVPDPSAFVARLAPQAAGAAAEGRGARGSRGLEGGHRKLGGTGSLWECSPLCVLDFYVEGSCRRQGVGRALLDCMMRNEGVRHPAVLAYVSVPTCVQPLQLWPGCFLTRIPHTTPHILTGSALCHVSLHAAAPLWPQGLHTSAQQLRALP